VTFGVRSGIWWAKHLERDAVHSPLFGAEVNTHAPYSYTPSCHGALTNRDATFTITPCFNNFWMELLITANPRPSWGIRSYEAERSMNPRWINVTFDVINEDMGMRPWKVIYTVIISMNCVT
jgi:hypothetical protein